MSISFARNKIVNVSSNFKDEFAGLNNNFGFASSLGKEQSLRLFDKYFLDFISFRKQRDLVITNRFLCFLLNQVAVDSGFKKKNGLTDLFKINSSKFEVDKDILLVSLKEINSGLELSCSVLENIVNFLESVDYFADDEFRKNISTKIEKTKKLTDDAILKTLTSNKKVAKKILLFLKENFN